MQRIAWATIEPLVSEADCVYFVRGTECHVGQGAGREEILAESITNAARTPDGVASYWHLLLSAGGVLMDIAHHRSGGNLFWTRPNAANRLAAETMLTYHGRRCPNVVIRAHKHWMIDSGRNYPVQAIGLPPFQLQTAFAHKIAPGSLSHVGGIILECGQGRYVPHFELYMPDPPKMEVVQ